MKPLRKQENIRNKINYQIIIQTWNKLWNLIGNEVWYKGVEQITSGALERKPWNVIDKIQNQLKNEINT